jgi:hypothetical protein
MFKKDKKIKELENRIQGMSEIITDFERSIFKVEVYEDCSLITNKALYGRSAVEIEVIETKNFIIDGAFDGKKVSFKLKHPRTRR